MNTISIALGAFFLIFAIFQFFRFIKITAKGVRTNAIIKDFKYAQSNMYFPVLEYTTKYGQVINKKSYVGSKKNRQQIGDKVAIIYNPDKPDEFLLDTGIDKYWKIIGSLIAGIAFMATGLFQLW
jgi:hypothetical protein